MRPYRFKKPLVESSTSPKSKEVLWVDVDEPTGKLKTIKEYRNNNWETAVSDQIFPSNWNIIKLPEFSLDYLQIVDVYVSLNSSEVYRRAYIPSEALLSQIPSGNEITIFYIETVDSATEKTKHVFICSKEGRNEEGEKVITINCIRSYYHLNNGDPSTGFDFIKEDDILVYYRPTLSAPFKWVTFRNTEAQAHPY